MHTYLYLVLQIVGLFLDLLASKGLSDSQKDIEILLLRHQLRILQRKLPNSQSPRISIWEKGILAVLAVQFRKCSTVTGKRLDEAILLFKPDTLLRWHRKLVRRKWTFQLAGSPVVCKYSSGACRALVQALPSPYDCSMHAYIHLVLYIFRLLLDLLDTSRLSNNDKELEILLLRHQLRIL